MQSDPVHAIASAACAVGALAHPNRDGSTVVTWPGWEQLEIPGSRRHRMLGVRIGSTADGVYVCKQLPKEDVVRREYAPDEIDGAIEHTRRLLQLIERCPC